MTPLEKAIDKASELLAKREDENEYHLHDVDRKWVIEAMMDYAEYCLKGTSSQTDENGKPLTYWGGLDKDYTEAQKNEERISNAKIMQDLKVQKLLDKDIFNQAILAMEEHYGSGCSEEIDAYFRGAKWMQNELLK